MYTAAYVINRVPSQGLKYMSPYEKMTGTKPNVSYFRVFGCVCYVFVPSHLHHKMEKKAIRCVFVGYDKERKGWRCCNPNTGKVYVSRNVIFDENSSWWSSNNEILPDTQQLKSSLEASQVNLEFESQEPMNKESEVVEQPIVEQEVDLDQSLRRSQRERRPNPKYANVAIVEDFWEEPSCFEEASVKDEWWAAMKEEMDALTRNETWALVPKLDDVKPITCKWVYKLKQRVDGSVERFKARLVARGFSQEHGINYEDTFSPVAKLTTIRVLLAITASKQWDLWQMDVNNAFLYGDLDHVIHMEQPKGFESEKYQDYVCKLKKAIYRLKQSRGLGSGK